MHWRGEVTYPYPYPYPLTPALPPSPNPKPHPEQVHEMESYHEPLTIVSHQAVLRVLYSYPNP